MAKKYRGRKRPPIQEVLSYDFPSLVENFSRRFKLPKRECIEIFTETKKWLWLANEFEFDRAVSAVNIEELPLFPHLLIIDEMWHSFILFTVPYSEFCNSFFGAYIHHHPNLSPESSKRKTSKLLAWFVDYVSDKLGEATAVKWLNYYPVRYAKLLA